VTTRADLVVTLTKQQLLALVGGSTDGIQLDGDASVLQTILGLTDQPDPNFAIVTPVRQAGNPGTTAR